MKSNAMKRNKSVEAVSPTRTRRRIEHEAESGASGALVGAVVGAAAGPPGAIAGAIIGGVAGVLAGAVMDQESSAKEERMRELDADVGVSSSSPAAPRFRQPPSASGAYPKASLGPAPVEEPPAEGVTFRVRHQIGATVTGRFTTWRGSLVFDEGAPENSRIEVEIDAASVDTKEPGRDAHLRSADFLDVVKYPKLFFKSTKVERAGDNFKLTGDLTIHGVTRSVTLDVEYADRAKHPRIGERAGFFAHASLDRTDWGLTWDRRLSDGIEICLGIEAAKAS
jgi:polyisoprenoid-binding protein YceI